MRKLALFLVYCFVSPAWADVPLFYEGFEYPDGSSLAPTGTTIPPEGLQHAASGKFWYAAGTGLRPIAVHGNVYDAGTGLPAPREEPPSSSVVLTGVSANGTSARIEIPNVGTGEKTVYWSAFFQIADIDGLAGAPNNGQGEVGVFVAGFNNTPGAQSGGLSAIGGVLALKRASANASSPRFNQYYAGTASSSGAADCTPEIFACTNRRFADYDAQLDPAVNPLADGSDLPKTYTYEGFADRSHFTAVPLSVGQTVFFVGSHQVINGSSNDVAKLWINPDPETFGSATPPEPNVVVTQVAAGGGNEVGNIRTFFLRDGATSPKTALFDELRVGLSWASVTDPTVGLPGDFNSDNHVDAADYVLWRDNENSTTVTFPNDNGLGNPIGQAHYNLWRSNFGSSSPGASASLGTTVPEPACNWLMLVLAGVAGWRRACLKVSPSGTKKTRAGAQS